MCAKANCNIGIGAAIVEFLSSKPAAKIVAVARSESNLKELQEKYGENKFQYVSGDVTDTEVSKRALSLAVTKFGGLDSIIFNAGVLEPVAAIADSNVSSWKTLFDINFFSIIELTQLALPELRKAHGSIIFVSSGASTKATHGWAAYGASKAALNHFALSLAAEVPQIRTLSVAPGVVDTKMQQDIREVFNEGMKPAELQRFVDLKSKGELLDPAVPAAIYGNLALRGIPESLNGAYVRYNDDNLKPYTE